MTRTFRSRRLALVGAVIVLGLTACGTSDGNGSSPTTSALPAPQVIEVAGGAVGSTSAEAPAADSVSGAEMSTKMMVAYLTYLYQGEVPDLTAPAASWVFPAGATATDEQLQVLAAAFGVEGEWQDVPEDQGGGRVAGDTGFSGPSVTVGTDALLSWWYSPGTGPIPEMDACSYYPPGDPMGDPASADLPVCAEPTPPADVPTGDEAEQLSAQLFTALGLDATQWSFDTYADEWGAYVTASYVIDGVATAVTMSIGYGAEGAITWANGFLATPERGADYPRIGVEAAVQRLNDQTLSWMSGIGSMARSYVEDAPSGASTDASSGVGVASAGAAESYAPVDTEPGVEPGVDPGVDPGVGEIAEPMPMPPIDCLVEPAVDPAVDPAVEPAVDAAAPSERPVPDTTVADTTVADTTSADTTPAGDPAVDPAVEIAPCEPISLPEPAPVEVTLTAPTASLEQVWAADGSVWLLPGYRFETSDGSWVTVVAVEDQYLQQADPVVDPLPLPVEVPPVETTTVVGVPATVTDEMPVEVPVDTAVTEPGVACAGLPTTITEPGLSEQVGDIIVGMCVDDAAAFITGYTPGASLRVVRENGVDLAVTADFNELRVNVAVEDGVITDVISLG